MDVGKFNGCRLDYRRRLWGPTSASHAVLVAAELLVI